MATHLEAISGATWSDEYCRDLWLAGHAYQFSIRRGTAAVNRWSALWRKDKSLDKEDIRLMRHYEAFHSWRFLRANARRCPLGAALSGFTQLSRATRWSFWAVPEEYA